MWTNNSSNSRIRTHLIFLSNSKNFKEILFFKCWKNFHFFLLLYRFLCHNSIYLFFEENYVSFASENVAKVYITSWKMFLSPAHPHFNGNLLFFENPLSNVNQGINAAAFSHLIFKPWKKLGSERPPKIPHFIIIVWYVKKFRHRFATGSRVL